MKQVESSVNLKFIEAIVMKDAPECEVFRENCMKLAIRYAEETSNADTNLATDPTRLCIGLYRDSIDKTFQRYGVSKSQNEMETRIEGAAISYLTLVMGKNYAVKNNRALKQLKQVEKATEKLLQKVDVIGFEEKGLILGAFTFDDMRQDILKLHRGEDDAKSVQEMQSRMTMVRFAKLEKELQYLTQISSSFSNTYIGRALQFGASGPKENTGLKVWVKEMAEIWSLVLEKSFNAPTDKTSGREKFLLFCEDLIEPLHFDLYGTDAIRNIFEKLKSKGALDYLGKK